MSDIDLFWIHTATIETFQGDGVTGPVYAAGVSITCLLDADEQLVLSPTGEQVTSSSTMLYTAISNAALFTPGTRVTSTVLGGDNTAKVLKVNPLTSGALALPDHVEVSLI